MHYFFSGDRHKCTIFVMLPVYLINPMIRIKPAHL